MEAEATEQLRRSCPHESERHTDPPRVAEVAQEEAGAGVPWLGAERQPTDGAAEARRVDSLLMSAPAKAVVEKALRRMQAVPAMQVWAPRPSSWLS